MNSKNPTLLRGITYLSFLICLLDIPFSATSQDSDLSNKLTFFLYSSTGETIEDTEAGTYWFVRVKDSDRNNLPAHLEIPGRYNGPDEAGDVFNLPVYVAYDFMGSNISSVSFSSEIKKIGDNCFAGCKNISSIVIPNSISEVGWYAFKECTSLSSVVVSPKNNIISSFSGCDIKKGAYPIGKRSLVAEIEVAYPTECAPTSDGLVFSPDNTKFYFAPWMITKLELPSTVTVIGSKAIAGCAELDSLIVRSLIPPAVGEDTFNGAIIKNLIVPVGASETYKQDNAWKQFASIIVEKEFTEESENPKDPEDGNLQDGQFFYGDNDKTKATLYRVISAKDKLCSLIKYGTSSLQWIGKLEIPSSVVVNGEVYKVIDVGSRAYSWQTKITEVVIPEGMVCIGDGAFIGCSGIKQVIFPTSLEDLGKEVFMDCTSLVEINLSATVKTIGAQAFKNCTSMWRGAVCGMVGNEAFAGCKALTTLDVHPTVTAIGADAFKDCTVLESVRVSDINKWFEIDFANENSNPLNFSHCLVNSQSLNPIYNIKIPEDIATLKNYSLLSYNGLTELTVPSNIDTIGTKAFGDCSGLEKLDLGKPHTVGVGFIDGCDKLTTITLHTSTPPVCNTKSFEGFGREKCNLIIPEGSKAAYLSNEEWAKFALIFDETEANLEIVIDKKELTLQPGDAVQLSAEVINGGTSNYELNWSSSDPSIATVDFNGLVTAVAEGSTIISVTDSNGMAKAFCTVTVEVDWQEGPIYTYTFDGQGLKYSILDPVELTVEVVDGKDVSGSLTIPDKIKINGRVYSVTHIGTQAFYDNKQVTNIKLPESIIEIGEEAFYLCNLTSLNIPSSVRTCKRRAFKNIHSVYVSSIKSLFAIQYEQDERLGIFTPLRGAKELYIDGVKITDLIIEEDIEKIPDEIFKDFTGLNSVTIGGNIKSIGHQAFSSSGLTSVIIDNSVTKIERYAFAWCRNLKKLQLSEGLTQIDSCAFFGCTKLESLIIPNTVERIDYYSFNDCENLNSLKLGGSLKYIGEYAFSSCYELKEIIIPPLVETIERYAFYSSSQYISKIKSIILGHRLKKLSPWSFNMHLSHNPYDPTKCYITSQKPPYTEDDRVFYEEEYSQIKLYVPDEKTKRTYTDSEYCWRLFDDINTMIVPSEITIDKTSIIGEAGDKVQLNAKFEPEDVTLPYIFWRSTNPNIATVDHTGLVTIHKDNKTSMQPSDENEINDCKIIAESLYFNAPIIEISVNKNVTAGVTELEAEDSFDANYDLENSSAVYNLNGIKVADSPENLQPGIYIVRKGMKVKKIIVR